MHHFLFLKKKTPTTYCQNWAPKPFPTPRPNPTARGNRWVISAGLEKEGGERVGAPALPPPSCLALSPKIGIAWRRPLLVCLLPGTGNGERARALEAAGAGWWWWRKWKAARGGNMLRWHVVSHVLLWNCSAFSHSSCFSFSAFALRKAVSRPRLLVAFSTFPGAAPNLPPFLFPSGPC